MLNYNEYIINELKIDRPRHSELIEFKCGIQLSDKDLKNCNWIKANELVNKYKGDGYTDWRLPTVYELKKIAKNTTRLDYAYGYWSSENDSMFAKWVRSISGTEYESDKINQNYNALAVRNLNPDEIAAYKYNL